jgi:hypothetical protein
MKINTGKIGSTLRKFVFISGISLLNCYGQDSSVVVKKKLSELIMDIPHSTGRDKLLWVPRTFVASLLYEQKSTYDTTYIKSFERTFVVTLPVTSRVLRFSLSEPGSRNKMNFDPNLEGNLGLSLSWRWARLTFNSRIKIFGGEEEKKGKSHFKDFQIHLFGRRVTTDFFIQSYKGFYISNSGDYGVSTKAQPYVIRPDVNAFNIGISNYYVVNYRKFSYRNSFAFVEQQRKSAGSVLLGFYYSYFKAGGEAPLISEPFTNSFDSLFYIRSVEKHSIGLNLGYIYTLVFLKRFYATASVAQGVGFDLSKYTRDDKPLHSRLHIGISKLNFRFSIGYDRGRYFIGTNGILDYVLLKRRSELPFEYSFGKVMVYVGYRFSFKGERKFLRRLKLIDYQHR